MSFTLSITGTSSTLITNHSPALELDGEYECGLLYISTFNSIPNVDYRNNKLYYGKNKEIEIPEGSYELQDLDDYLKEHLTECTFTLTCNNNTLKTSILCSENIYFDKERTRFRNRIYSSKYINRIPLSCFHSVYNYSAH